MGEGNMEEDELEEEEKWRKDIAAASKGTRNSATMSQKISNRPSRSKPFVLSSSELSNFQDRFNPGLCALACFACLFIGIKSFHSFEKHAHALLEPLMHA